VDANRAECLNGPEDSRAHAPVRPPTDSTFQQIQRKIERVRWSSLLWFLGVVAVVCGAERPIAAQDAAPSPLFRLFLTDGQIVTTYGEYARVDDVVVASVGMGQHPDTGEALLEMVTLPADVVDWQASEAYTASVRLALYTASTAERDYAAFTEDVARTLDRVSVTPDALEKIALVEQARSRLSTWPQLHYGYRQDDIDAMLSVLDDVLVGLRASAGQQHFTLVLAAGAPIPLPPPPLLPPPTFKDVVAQALGLSRHLTDAGERIQVLTHVARLTSARTVRRQAWARDARRAAQRQLEIERRASDAYARLRQRTMARSAQSLSRADVRALMAIRRNVDAQDTALGRQRPAEIGSLYAHLDAQLDEARQLRLALDRWEQRRPILEAYVRRASDVLAALAPMTGALEDIKTLAGPPLVVLDRVDAQLAGPRALLHGWTAPGEAAGVHAIIESAIQMTASALRERRLATLSADLPQAWQASAAAAGALLMLDRAGGELAHLLRAPVPGLSGQGPTR
jgi:hypothetical protein